MFAYAFLIYLVTRLDDIRASLYAPGELIVGASFVCLGLAAYILYSAGSKKPWTRYRDASEKALKTVTFLLLSALTVGPMGQACLPTKKDVAVIVAGTWALHSDEVRQVPDNVVKVINHYLREAAEAEGITDLLPVRAPSGEKQ